MTRGKTNPSTPKVTTKLNHNYTITCVDEGGRSVSFRDIAGKDLEMLDLVMGESGDNVNPDHVLDILHLLCTNRGAQFKKFPPRIIRTLYTELTIHILKNYIPKEN